MITLSIDSSSKAATAALLKDGKLMSEINLNDKHEHSVVLMGMIDKLLKYNDLTIDDIDNFAVSKGPGSFTGLRIGMAAVKGMSFGSGKPYISISSLDALAYTASCFDGLICPVMDALRNSVYTALYHASCSKEDGSVSLERLTEYEALDISDLTELIKSKNEKVMFIGDGVDKYKNYFLENCPDAYFPPQHLNIVHASALGELASKLLSQGIHDEPESAPFYLKKPQAQRELEEKKKEAPEMSIEVVKMTKDMLDEVCAISDASFHDPWSYKAYEQELRSTLAHYFVIMYDGNTAGFMGTWIIADESHVTNIAVSPSFRRKGLGEKLLKYVIDYCRNKGCRAVTLEVRASNTAAINLYEKLGFKTEGIRKGYYSDNHEDALLMWVRF